MTSVEFQKKATMLVANYVLDHLDKSDDITFSIDDVYVVWMCKTLQNSKALLSTTLRDGMYYEVTHNGDRREFYLDAYKKFENKCYEEGW